jgi:thiol:disulfide interchange protein DsbA
MTRLAWLAAVSCLVLAACGQQSSAPPASEPSAATTTAPATSQPAAPTPASTNAATAPAAPAEVVNAGEDLETVDSEAAPAASASPLLTAAMAAAPPATPPGNWIENQHYLKLVPTQPTVTNLKTGRVEIVEVFWYGCPHCYALEPMLESWLKKGKPAYVDFVRIPATWNPGTKLIGRMYYTVQSLGKLDAMHAAIFNTMHSVPATLIDPNGDEAETGKRQASFAAQYGVSEADYLKAYNSFGVDQQLRRAEQLNRAYLVTGVPTFVVDGKYVTDVGHAGGEDKLFQLLGDLATMENTRR